jgi:hypothetical protein
MELVTDGEPARVVNKNGRKGNRGGKYETRRGCHCEDNSSFYRIVAQRVGFVALNHIAQVPDCGSHEDASVAMDVLQQSTLNSN